MTSQQAERLCKAFKKARWPAGVECEVFPVSYEGDDHTVILSWSVGDLVRQKPVTVPWADKNLQRYYREAMAWRDKASGSDRPPMPPVLTASSEDEPRRDWIEQTRCRLVNTDAPIDLCKRTIVLLESLEFDRLPLPNVDELDDQLYLNWEGDGKSVFVLLNDESISVTVNEEGQPIPWAEDVHRWNRSRVVPSLRVWLRWMFPEISPSCS